MINRMAKTVAFAMITLAIFTSCSTVKQSTSSVAASHKLKNAPVFSAGHGKELGDFQPGVHTNTMTSAGLERKYIIDIPANYDKNKPYRLIFAMHMMGGSMETMVKNNFYGLKTYAERDNVPVIFVAPQGYTDRWPWRGNDDKDHIFFADMLALFKDKLSIDTSRVFCVGFSFGAMVTYSFSLEFQKDLRAVACYAPANWNIYLPTDTHEPIAFYSTTGTQDLTCIYVHSDALKQGGKYCVLTHLEDNGVKELPNIPTATSATHVTTEFKGMDENILWYLAPSWAGTQILRAIPDPMSTGFQKRPGLSSCGSEIGQEAEGNPVFHAGVVSALCADLFLAAGSTPRNHDAFGSAFARLKKDLEAENSKK